MRDDSIDLFRIVTEFFQRRFDRLIHNFQHAAAGKQFVFHERDVGFDSGCIAIHQETNCPGWREHGDLRVAITVALTQIGRAFPSLARFLF